MAFWLDIAGFVLKTLFIVAALGALAALIARLTGRGATHGREIKVRSLNESYDQMRDELDAESLDKKEWKLLAKARKREAKAAARVRAATPAGKRVYVLGFEGDLMASAVKRLGREIDAVLTVARPKMDEVVLRLQSSGGTVTGYGLAAAEIARLRDRMIKVTVSVDQVAASGGYMMACAADRIVAAPFALIGSIGVVAQRRTSTVFSRKMTSTTRNSRRANSSAPSRCSERSRRPAASIFAARSRTRTPPSRPSSPSDARLPTSPKSRTATCGWRARRWASAWWTPCRPATISSSA